MKEIVGPGVGRAEKEIVGAEMGAEALVDRDQWDRPLILPRGGHKADCGPRKGKSTGCTCMVGYTRVSTMAEALMDSYGLSRWQKSNVVKGLARRPDLINAARLAQNPGDLYEIVDTAEMLGDNDVAARNGDVMHKLTERLDNGEPIPDDLPENMVAMLEAFEKTMRKHGFTTTDTEQFVVQDKVQTAGTFDKRIEGADAAYIADVKTGQNLNYLAMKVTQQVALYSASDYYDIGTGDRTPLGVDRDRGVLIWLPWVEDAKAAECELRWLDLKLGRQMVLQAIKVRDFRKLTANQILPRIK